MGVRERITIEGRHRITLRNLLSGRIRTAEFTNIIVGGGRNMIARRLAGEGNACDITYGAVGKGTTPPAVGDTTLEAELARKPVTRRSAAGSQALYTVYFGPNEANGALTEYALFGEDADGTADSGTMFNRAAIDLEKTSSYTMTIESTITIS